MPTPKLERPLTPSEKAFVELYLGGETAVQAYVKTRPNGRTPDPRAPATETLAYRLLKSPKIRPIINAARQEVAERTQDHLIAKYAATKERVVEELAKIAFTDYTDVTTWDKDGIKTKDSAELDDATKASVVEVIQSKAGVRVKLADKQRALEGLAKALGLHKEDKSNGPTLAVQFIIEKN